MKYFLQTLTLSDPESVRTKTHSIVTNGEGRELFNERYGNWYKTKPDASGCSKQEISCEEYEILHKKAFPYSSLNAKEEFKEMVSKLSAIICAEIVHFPWNEDKKTQLCLKSEFSQEEYESFLDSLDFWYDNGHGEAFLSGTIWFQDGTYATCEEYDGSEHWVHHKTPEIPEYLR